MFGMQMKKERQIPTTISMPASLVKRANQRATRLYGQRALSQHVRTLLEKDLQTAPVK